MKTPFLLSLTLLATLFFSTTANAQNTDGLDLPITEPVYGSKPNVVPPVSPPPTTDDPRDEPPPVFYGEEIESPTKSVIYVIDISGSMDWAYMRPVSRWESARKELNRYIDGLPSDYTFNISAYNSFIIPWKNARVRVTPGTKEEAKAWVNSLKPDGATATGPAVAIALEDRENMCIVLLTDGAPNAPIEDPAWHRELIQRQNEQRAKIHVFGVDAQGTMRSFCQSVASDSGGTYVDIN